MSAGRVTSRGYPVTAWSAANGLGTTTETVMEALHAGRSGLSKAPEGTPFETFCGAIEAELPALPDSLSNLDLRNNRIAWCALAQIAEAVDAACSRWGAQRVGIAVGSSTTAMDETERAYGVYLRTGSVPEGFDVQAQASPEGLLRAMRALTEAAGPAVVVSTACSSSGKVFGTAKRWLDAGIVDAVIVGGADSLCQTTLRGFRALSLVSAEARASLRSERCGINIGEGAAFALLERSGAGPRLLGVGETADAHHMSSPDPEGHGARLAMQAALADAGRQPARSTTSMPTARGHASTMPWRHWRFARCSARDPRPSLSPPRATSATRSARQGPSRRSSSSSRCAAVGCRPVSARRRSIPSSAFASHASPWS